MTSLDWQDEAACAGQPHAMFLSSYRHHRDPETDVHRPNRCALCNALNNCARCPVRNPCLEFALAIEGCSYVVRDGIWGGYTPGRRQSLYDQRRREASAALIEEVAS